MLACEFHVDGYNFFLSGLEDNGKRGLLTLFYIASGIEVSVVDIPETFYECLFLLLKASNQGLVNKFVLGNIYRIPNSLLNNDKNVYDLLHQIEKKISVPKLIAGDFNFSNIDWYPVTGIRASAKCVALSDNEMAFVNSLRENLLFQHVVNATRQQGTDTPHILDLVITSDVLCFGD